MGFVDDQRVVVAQLPVALQLAQQDAVRHHFEPGVGSGAIRESDLEADGAADVGAQFRRDPIGDGARGDASRLRVADQPERAASGFEADLRQLRRLAGAGRAAHDDQLMVPQRFRDLFAMRHDRQRVVELDLQGQRAQPLDARQRIVDRLAERLGRLLRLRIGRLAREQPVELARQPRPIGKSHSAQPLAQGEQRRVLGAGRRKQGKLSNAAFGRKAGEE